MSVPLSSSSAVDVDRNHHHHLLHPMPWWPWCVLFYISWTWLLSTTATMMTMMRVRGRAAGLRWCRRRRCCCCCWWWYSYLLTLLVGPCCREGFSIAACDRSPVIFFRKNSKILFQFGGNKFLNKIIPVAPFDSVAICLSSCFCVWCSWT